VCARRFQPLPPLFAVGLTDCNITRKIDQPGERKKFTGYAGTG
jgi:hypothetical protein